MFSGYLVTPAEAVATAYSEALSNQDLATIEQLLAPEADIPNDPSMLPARWEYERVTGWVFPTVGCDEQSSGPEGTLVSCRY